MPPPSKPVEAFPLTVLLVKVTSPSKILMPPPKLATFPLMVLLVIIVVPAKLLKMPPEP
jgi:hypothetical protein